MGLQTCITTPGSVLALWSATHIVQNQDLIVSLRYQPVSLRAPLRLMSALQNVFNI